MSCVFTSISGARPRKQPRRSRQKGSSLIESSFTFLITISLILFIMDVGRFLLTQQYVAERVRLVARLAVVNDWDAPSIQNYLCYGTITAPAGNPAPRGLFGLTPSNVASVWRGTATSPDYRLQITVSGLPVLTFVPMMPNNLSIIPVTATAAAQSLGATN
ncbi:MAG: hypothetical protein ABJF23_02000 [Bryobacteraceae bacterium]